MEPRRSLQCSQKFVTGTFSVADKFNIQIRARFFNRCFNIVLPTGLFSQDFRSKILYISHFCSASYIPRLLLNAAAGRHDMLLTVVSSHVHWYNLHQAVTLGQLSQEQLRHEE